MNCLALPLSCGPQNLSMFPEQDCAPWLVWKAENVSYPACLIFPDFAEAWQLIHPLVSCLISWKNNIESVVAKLNILSNPK